MSGYSNRFASSAKVTLNHSGATMSTTPATVSTFIALALARVQPGEDPQQ